ncbi:hypothetical protein [Chryseobacterium scophthalmum]|uniref:hypothetical protein n=1 Tax=Chryseobacterium scophthalmum TaxID=59733 RepID=UPI001AEC4550|nr:hypothetical protein [Chryseobacterium scophthalmum]
MKRLFLLFFLLPLFFSAQLRLSNIYELYNMKTENIDEYAINGLGFKKIGENDALYSVEKEFYNGKNSFKETIYIKLISPKIFDKNIVTIRMGNEYSVQNLKSELITDGFEYMGDKELYSGYFVHLYTKPNTIIMISKKPNANSLYEINIVKREN